MGKLQKLGNWLLMKKTMINIIKMIKCKLFGHDIDFEEHLRRIEKYEHYGDSFFYCSRCNIYYKNNENSSEKWSL